MGVFYIGLEKNWFGGLCCSSERAGVSLATSQELTLLLHCLPAYATHHSEQPINLPRVPQADSLYEDHTPGIEPAPPLHLCGCSTNPCAYPNQSSNRSKPASKSCLMAFRDRKLLRTIQLFTPPRNSFTMLGRNRFWIFGPIFFSHVLSPFFTKCFD